MHKVIVTGGAGFIGSHLTEQLLAEGYSVTVLDNFATGRRANLAAVTDHSLLEIADHDITVREGLQQHFDGCHTVFHLAGLADIVPSIQAPNDYHAANVNGTLNILEAARAADVQRFVYAASSSCYGIPNTYPTPETSPATPQYPYALTKYVGEQYCMHWAQVYNLPVVSLRLFNVYGPRSRTSGTYGAVFGVFLAQKLAGKPFTVVGDGSQTRDFTYVTDVARAFIAAARSEQSGKIYNVGSGNTYSINRLVELLGGPVEYIPKRPGEPDCTFADTTAITRELGWNPAVGFEEGVANMLEAIDLWKDAPVWNSDSIATATQEWFTCLS